MSPRAGTEEAPLKANAKPAARPRRGRRAPRPATFLNVGMLATTVVVAELLAIGLARTYLPTEPVLRVLADTVVTSVLVVLLVWRLILRRINLEIVERERAEEALEGTNADLEAAVASRTAALRESEERFRVLVESAPIAVVVLRNGHFLYANPAALRLSGARTLGELQQRTVLDLIPAEDRPGISARMREGLEGHPLLLRETRVLRLDGSVVPCESVGGLVNFEGEPAVLAMIRDITERRRAEEERERLLVQTKLDAAEVEAVLAAQNEAVLTYDTERRVRRVNPSFVAAYGFDPVGLPLAEIVRRVSCRTLDGSPLVPEELPTPRALRGESTTSAAFLVKRGDGSEAVVEASSGPMRVGARVTGSVTVWRDVTERRRAEEHLRHVHELLEAITTGTELIIAAVDTDLRYTYFNRAHREEIRRLTGKDLQVGAAVGDVFEEMPEARTIALEGWRRALRGESRVENMEFGEAGRYRRVYSVSQAPIRDAEGNIIGAGAVSRDVTAQVQLERALHETRAKLETLKRDEEIVRAERARLFGVLDQLPIFVYLRDSGHRVVFANRYFREQFGDPTARPCYKTLGRRDTPCEGCDFARVFNLGEAVEWEWAAPTGREYQVHHYPFVDTDGTELVLALGIDVTERKLAYEAEEAARRTADALREVSLELTRTLDVDTVLLSLLDHLRRLVAFDRSKIMLLESDGCLVVRAVLNADGGVHLPAEPRPRFHPSENPVVSAILATREATLISDIHEHPVFGSRADPAVEHSWIGIPLVARGTVIGMYSLGRRAEDGFTQEHRKLAEALSAQAAVAIDNALLFEQVQAARARMQTLSRRLVEVQEFERRTIARELHDEAGQSLTSILFGLRLLEKGVADNERAMEQIADLKQTTDAVMEGLHRLATDLRPASLEHLGFVAAVHQHLAKLEPASGIRVNFLARGIEETRLPSAVETTLFRIVQEALTNVLRHARASRVDVLAERRGDGVIVVIEDDGVGFDADAPELPGHLGRVGMRERAEALGGRLTMESAPGAGTTVVVEVPCVDSSPDRG